MSFEELLKAIKRAQASASAPVTRPVAPSPKKPRAKKERKKPALDLTAIKEALRDIIQEALQEVYRKGLEEGLRRAREVSEENIVRAVWNSEPSGVKLSNLTLVFGKNNANRIQQILLNLERRNILVRDRNRWWHVNPLYAEQILAHYGIQFTQEELEAVKRRLRNRVYWGRLREPELEKIE